MRNPGTDGSSALVKRAEQNRHNENGDQPVSRASHLGERRSDYGFVDNLVDVNARTGGRQVRTTAIGAQRRLFGNCRSRDGRLTPDCAKILNLDLTTR